uniref:Uncharacterized protein n=1 Tax=Arundo donax TaxID=35708 RepID=A0A0A9STE7_ARUDO
MPGLLMTPSVFFKWSFCIHAIKLSKIVKSDLYGQNYLDWPFENYITRFIVKYYYCISSSTDHMMSKKEWSKTQSYIFPNFQTSYQVLTL